MSIFIIVFSIVVRTIHVTAADSQNVTVRTTIGNITGQTETAAFNGTQHSLITFLGIPYAEPPTGSRRFHRPVKKSAFTETFRADTMPPICYQNISELVASGGDPDILRLSEDCLFLNIYLPGETINTNVPRAVMFWIHGGGFQTGYQNLYNGKAFVALNDIMLVTINYRLSVLGFLSTAKNNLSGNYGLWDQHMAIQWVHDHIDRFGGDPNRVTIFGESAGSASVIYQTLYEGNHGLFQRAIAQSGSVSNDWAYDTNPGAKYAQFVRESGCVRDSQIDTIICLRDIPADSLRFNAINPVLDGEFVKTNPADVFRNKTATASKLLKAFGEYDVIIGLNSAEGGMYVSYVLDPIAIQNGENISDGYSISMFESIVIPFTSLIMQSGISELVHKAIALQYIDWSDPSNRQSVFQATVNLLSDAMINAGVMQAAKSRAAASEDRNLYFYVFDYKTNFTFVQDERYPGANHADEIAYVLGFPNGLMSLFINDSFEDPAMVVSQNDLQLSKKIMQYWANFAKSGDPNDDGTSTSELTDWPVYDSNTQKYIRFTGNMTSFPVESRYAASRMHFWNEMVPSLNENCNVECESCDKDSVSSAYVISPSLSHLLITLICSTLYAVL